MKKILSLFIIVLSIQTISAQTITCTIEPGKGCGDVKLGKSRNEIESVFGKASSDRYYKNGFALVYNAENKVNEIMFFLNRNENIFQQYFAFPTMLPGNLTAQTTKAQLTSKYGKPIMTREFDALDAKISTFEYPGIRIAFDREQLFYVEIFTSKEAFALAGEQSIFEDEITFGNDDKKETTEEAIDFDKLKSNITFGLPTETKPATTQTSIESNTALNEDKFENKKIKIYLYNIDKPFLNNADGISFQPNAKEWTKSKYKLTEQEFTQLLDWCKLDSKPLHLSTPENIKSTINSNQETFLYNAYIIGTIEATDGNYYSVIQIPFAENTRLSSTLVEKDKKALYFLTPNTNVYFHDIATDKSYKKMLQENNHNTKIYLPGTNKTTEPQTCKNCEGKGFTYNYFCKHCKNTGFVNVIGSETKKKFCVCITTTQMDNELKNRKEKCKFCNGSGKIK